MKFPKGKKESRNVQCLDFISGFINQLRFVSSISKCLIKPIKQIEKIFTPPIIFRT